MAGIAGQSRAAVALAPRDRVCSAFLECARLAVSSMTWQALALQFAYLSLRALLALRCRWIALLTAATFLLAVPNANAQQPNPDMESLKGLTGVMVVVERVDPDAEREGLTTSAIQMDIEVRLRLAAIPVLTREEGLKLPTAPYLHVMVSTFTRTSGPTASTIYAYNIVIALRQNVNSIVRPHQMISGAATWDRSELGTVGAGRLPEIRQTVKDLTDIFINDWLTANPKR
jgi:hypothetical protein